MPSLDRLASKLRQTLESLVDVSVPSFEEVRELLGHVDGILANAQHELAGYLTYEDPDDPDKEDAPCPFAELATADSHLDEVREILKAHKRERRAAEQLFEKLGQMWSQFWAQYDAEVAALVERANTQRGTWRELDAVYQCH